MNSLINNQLGFPVSNVITYEYACDIFGLSDYLCQCCQKEIDTYYRQYNVSIRHCEVNGYNLLCKLSCGLSMMEKDDFLSYMRIYVRKKIRELSIVCLPQYGRSDLPLLKHEIYVASNRKATVTFSYNTDTVWYIGDKMTYSMIESQFVKPSRTMDNTYHSPMITDDSMNGVAHSDSLLTKPTAMDMSDSLSFVSQNSMPLSDAPIYSSHFQVNDTQSYSSLRYHPRETQSMSDTRSISSDRYSYLSHRSFPNRYITHYEDDDNLSSASYSTLSSTTVPYSNPFSSSKKSSPSVPPPSHKTEIKKRDPFNPLKMDYKPTYSLNKGETQCPLYSISYHTIGTRLSIGHNSEFATFMITFLFDEFLNELRLNDIQIDGYYLNDHGFFLIVPPGTREGIVDKVVSNLYLKHSTNLLKSQRFRIPLDNESYIKYLIYIAETMKGRVVVHRVNEESICFYGVESELKKISEEAKSIEKSIGGQKENGGDDGEENLKEYEDTIYPLASVTSNLLQQIWKQGYTPRQLDNVDIGFNCFISRCRRAELIEYVKKLLSAGEPIKITNVINCTDNYYLIFKGTSAPNRDRWKKYKSKVNPDDMNIDFDKVMVNVDTRNPNFEQLRKDIEQKSMSNATLWVNNGTCYIVGERSALQALQNSIQRIVR